ncbi:MAG: hypothetical protein IKT35_04375, partial [Clostridia bacterium]|nr:hypothetical protein [Clostridia bacterium]
YHHAGMIYVQEPAAMMPIECLDFSPDWFVLDMCAAPGGKSTQIKNKLGENGVLVSNEIIPSRCKILTGNIERLGLKNVITTCMDTFRLAEIFEGRFDLVSVDAPCSGEGMFRKEEIAVSEWSLENVEKCAERQKDILNNAAKCVKNGGYIIYATCTFSLEENEMMVDDFLKNHPDFELIKPNEKVFESTADGIRFDGCSTENIEFCRRFYPHKGLGEGQFAAIFHNTLTATESKKIQSKKSGKIDPIIFEFLDDTLTEYDKGHIVMNNDIPTYFTPDFEVPSCTIFSHGVNIGEVRKNYVLPHHQFFMAMGKNFKRKIEIGDNLDLAEKYIRGLEIPADCENGWAVVTINGCPLGGAKVSSGIAKNHYPKGLRIK